MIFSKCWNTCTLHNKIVAHLSALNNCIWLYLMFAVATISSTLCTNESYLYLHDLCVLVYAFMYFYLYFYVYMGQVPEIKLMMMMMITHLCADRRTICRYRASIVFLLKLQPVSVSACSSMMIAISCRRGLSVKHARAADEWCDSGEIERRAWDACTVRWRSTQLH